MANFCYNRIVEISEKVNLDSSAHCVNKKLRMDLYVGNHEKLVNPEYGEWEITRNLIDDTFDFNFKPHYIYYQDQSLGLIGDTYAFDEFKLNINNKINITEPRKLPIPEYSSWINEQRISYKNFGHKIKVHRSLLKNTKFRNLESLVYIPNHINVQRNENDDSKWVIKKLEYLKSFNNFEFEDIKIDKHIDANQIVNLKTIKNIKVKSNDQVYNDWIDYYNEYINSSNIEVIKSQVEYEYNNVYLIPSKLSKYDNSKKIFDVYMKNPNDESFNKRFIYDYKFQNIRYRSSGIPTWQKLFFEKKWDETNTFQDATKIGEINLDKPFYYDYESKKLKLGKKDINDENGDIIPYNFSGNYLREIEFDVNSAFKKIKININQKVDTPVLDIYKGEWDLKIDNNFRIEVNGKFWKMNFENINKIKKEWKNDDFNKREIINLTNDQLN